MDRWNVVSKEKPPIFCNVLLAFAEHWNQVVGFWTGKEFYETSAHDHNSRIVKPNPQWWAEVPAVPHYPRQDR